MSATNDNTSVAQNNQVPPELRQWAQRQCKGVDKIERFDPENESRHRGWKIEARMINTYRMPDGYETGYISNVVNEPTVRLQVREE